MTTEQKIQVLREDFLKRNGENYTSAERSGRLGWEQTLSSGSAYSAAMLSPKDDADLHRIAITVKQVHFFAVHRDAPSV